MKYKISISLILASLMISSSLFADVYAKKVPYTDGTTQLEGVLAFDPTIPGKQPGILLIHEWWGRNDYVEQRAREYAALGYTAFAVDMYGKGVLAQTPEEAGKLSSPFYQDRSLFRRRAAAGLAVLANNPNVDANRIGALGYCFGGSGVLELARAGENLKGVIVFHGGLSSPTPEDAKRIKGKVLALIGADDPFISAAERAGFKAEMNAAKVSYEYIEYPGAQHAFTNPGVDEKNIKGAAYNKAADKESFAKSKDFLASVLSAKQNS